MKTITVIFLLIVFQMKGFAQVNEFAPEFKFEKEEIDYGTINYNGNGDREFKFTNVGKSALIISGAFGSSSSVTLEWPKEAINPGESGIIKVHYTTNLVGTFRKSVLIRSNADNYKPVWIKGVVQANPAKGKAALAANIAKIKFETEIIDYGSIAWNSDPNRQFKFKNTGTEPLIISNAQGSCGCLIIKWPTEPIMPGKSGAITAYYDTKRIGLFEKKITVTSNAVQRSSIVLTIKGQVLPLSPTDSLKTFFLTGQPESYKVK